jgi:hypothetical protein
MSNKNVKYGDGFADITLSRDFDLGGTKIKALRMREPTVKDQRVAFKDTTDMGEREAKMFQNLCELAPSDLDRLPLKDYARLQAAYEGFFD